MVGARGGGGFWWGRVGVASFGCAWWCWVVALSPLVVGWVGGGAFSLVASRGGVGFGWWLGLGVDNKGGGVGWLLG